MSGEFVISLDFELLWGVRDHHDRESYGANILGAREAVPRMLDLFERHGVCATWATVGFLFCESRDELMASLPPADARPIYARPALSNYAYLEDVGENEAKDPYSFAPSLIARIAETPGQEIGTHTLSHFYCLEDGQTPAAFEADIQAAIALAARRGITLRSIVFPRNQYAPDHLEICRRNGICAYRGNPSAWAYRAAKGSGQTPLRLAMRLLDAHTGILGPHAHQREGAPLCNIPASQFLRPCAGRLAPLHGRHVRTIMSGMTHAAQTGLSYHLWWHPHNFGRELERNIAALRRLLTHFTELGDRHGMISRNMAAHAS